MNKKITLLLLSLLLNIGVVSAKNLKISSPNGKLQLELSDRGGVLSYRLLRGDEVLVDESKIEIIEDATTKITETQTAKYCQTWQTTWGQFSQISDNHTQAMLTLQLNDRDAIFYARLFDDGVGFRYELSNFDKTEQKALFYCDYNLGSANRVYYTIGEQPPVGPIAMCDLEERLTSSNEIMKLPLYVERDDQTIMVLLESDLYSAKGFDVMWMEYGSESKRLYATNKVDLSVESLDADKLVTPWRVILVGDNAAQVVTNTVGLNLAAPCQLENTDWVVPGKTLWDWRVMGYTAADGFVYGADNKSYERFIDFAAENNIEYFLIDNDWYTKAENGVFHPTQKLHLPSVVEYAQKRGVKLILYYDRHRGYYGDEALYRDFHQMGMYGVKYGFMAHDVQFTRGSIAAGAENQLLVNYHDQPVPMTGAERTMPNAITREFCHAQQDSRRAFTPSTFIRMALINAITGPLDMNNGNFDINGINSGVRKKSPKAKNSYQTTVISEVARTLIINTGLLCLPDAPEEYRAKSDLFDFIRLLPIGRWDESVVLNAKMDEWITTARRSGDEWFIASVDGGNGCELNIDTSILSPNITYTATIYQDGADAHCVENPESYTISTILVKRGDEFTVKLAPGGGNAIHLKP